MGRERDATGIQNIDVHQRDQHNVVSGEESGCRALLPLADCCTARCRATLTVDNHQGQCQQSRSIGSLADLISHKAFTVSIMTTTTIISSGTEQGRGLYASDGKWDVEQVKRCMRYADRFLSRQMPTVVGTTIYGCRHQM
jgi:hypothetical protein